MAFLTGTQYAKRPQRAGCSSYCALVIRARVVLGPVPNGGYDFKAFKMIFLILNIIVITDGFYCFLPAELRKYRRARG